MSPTLLTASALRLALGLGLLGLSLAQAHAQEDESLENKQAIEDFDLEALLSQPVTTATKSESTAEMTPAVVTVISAQEIQTRGLRSLAEILASVPGFYDIYDLNTHNIGVRGVNGGARASGNVLKLMIDGQPVALRTNTGNFYGEELIPIEAIERVEILRGPASALYGANAFLGVVNIITRSDFDGVLLTGQAGSRLEHGRFGGGALLGGREGDVEVLIGVHGMWIDRGQLELPDTSPQAQGRTDDPDLALPLTVFAKAQTGDVASTGRFTAMASIQRLWTHGELSDYEPLSLTTGIPTVFELINQHYRLSYRIEPLEGLSISASATLGFSDPGDDAQINNGSTTSVLQRRASTRGYEGSLEVAYAFLDMFQLTLGFDLQIDDHELPSYDQLLLEDVGDTGTAGTQLPRTRGGDKQFQNFGGFFQLIYDITPEFAATAGLRVDYHNIYATRFSPRAALVYAPTDSPFILKLLYGTSFKAPSAEQLFTATDIPLDIQGNDALEAQTAQTGEIAGSLRLGDWGEILANIYVTAIDGRVEYLQQGLFLEAANSLQEVLVGGELDARFTPLDWLDVRLGVGLAKSVQRTQSDETIAFTGVTLEQPLFPVFQVHTQVGFELPYNIHISPEVSVFSPRAASQSNALIVGEQYDTPWRVMTALAISTEQELWESHPTRLTLRASNLAHQTAGDPGFAGVDYPFEGFSFLFTLSQHL